MRKILCGMAMVGLLAPDAFAANSTPPVSAVHAAVRDELKTTITGARSFAVFEGVPREKQKELIAAEQARGKNGIVRYDDRSIEAHQDQWFYPQGRAIASEAAGELLSSLLAAAVPYRGMKLCGGFHADYALQWSGPGGRYEVQVCFGCSELKLITPEAVVNADIATDHAERLRELFGPYRKSESKS